jgi:hypothetical protein
MDITIESIKGREVMITKTPEYTVNTIITNDDKYTVTYIDGKDSFKVINHGNNKSVDVEVHKDRNTKDRAFAFLNLLERSINCPLTEIA